MGNNNDAASTQNAVKNTMSAKSGFQAILDREQEQQGTMWMQSQVNRRICPGAAFRQVGQIYGGPNAVGLLYLQGKHLDDTSSFSVPICIQITFLTT